MTFRRQGWGANEVNRRSVQASQRFVHAGLTHFCAGMNLSPPVTKKAYNEHLIQIEKAVMANVENCMQEAAQRLFQKMSVERLWNTQQDAIYNKTVFECLITRLCHQANLHTCQSYNIPLSSHNGVYKRFTNTNLNGILVCLILAPNNITSLGAGWVWKFC